MSTFMLDDDGVPRVGERSYPWAVDIVSYDVVHSETLPEAAPAGDFVSFRLPLENAWDVWVSWFADHEDGGSCCCEMGVEGHLLEESVFQWDQRREPWPHGTPHNWCFPLLRISSPERFEEIVADASKRPSPPWLGELTHPAEPVAYISGPTYRWANLGTPR